MTTPETALGKRAKIVLGIDDTVENLAFLKFVVEASGYSFLGSANGHEALTLLTRLRPRVIVLDVELPELDGFEVCRRMRKMTELDRTPIVFLTARKSVEDFQTGLAAGGNDFLVKPFAAGKLRDRIVHWANRPILKRSLSTHERELIGRISPLAAALSGESFHHFSPQ